MGVDNYARFYALLRRMPCADKETLVSQYSDGRTTHLRELSESEYCAMCDAMARVAGEDESRRGLRRLRSAVLHRMQLLGVDTADWGKVDKFCQDKRIAGMTFRDIDVEGLDALLKKLHAIRRKRETYKK